jgi:hypothetical protein
MTSLKQMSFVFLIFIYSGKYSLYEVIRIPLCRNALNPPFRNGSFLIPWYRGLGVVLTRVSLARPCGVCISRTVLTSSAVIIIDI